MDVITNMQPVAVCSSTTKWLFLIFQFSCTIKYNKMSVITESEWNKTFLTSFYWHLVVEYNGCYNILKVAV
jgi:hypothetical protein